MAKTKAKSDDKKVWQRPEFRRIASGSAEFAGEGGIDGSGLS
jgi:hypothetical protein